MLAALRNEWGVMSRYRGCVNGCVGSEQRATGIEIVGNRWPTMTTIDLKLKIDNHGLIWLIDNQVATWMCFYHWNGRDDWYWNSTSLAKIERSQLAIVMAPHCGQVKSCTIARSTGSGASEVPFLPRICLIWNTCWQGFFFQVRYGCRSVKRGVFVDQTSSDKWIATGIMSWDSQVPSGKLT